MELNDRMNFPVIYIEKEFNDGIKKLFSDAENLLINNLEWYIMNRIENIKPLYQAGFYSFRGSGKTNALATLASKWHIPIVVETDLLKNYVKHSFDNGDFPIDVFSKNDILNGRLRGTRLGMLLLDEVSSECLDEIKHQTFDDTIYIGFYN